MSVYDTVRPSFCPSFSSSSPVDDLVVRARAVEKPRGIFQSGGVAVPEHRHQRDDAGSARDEQQRPSDRPIPYEIAADRPADLEPIADLDRVVQKRRYLTVGDPLDGDVDLSFALGLGGDRVAPLRGVAVRGGEPYVVMLPRPVRDPVGKAERERLDLGRFGSDRFHRGDLPLEWTFHLASRPNTALLSTGLRGCCNRAIPRSRVRRAPSREGHGPISRFSRSQVRHDETRRAAVLRCERLAFVFVRDEGLTVYEIGKRDVRRVSAVAESGDEHAAPIELDVLQKDVDADASPVGVELGPFRDARDVLREDLRG